MGSSVMKGSFTGLGEVGAADATVAFLQVRGARMGVFPKW